jgi:hypothetical protein
VVPRAVPLANAAAKEAREAAASCDAALTDSAGEADMSNMRGWLMMVATLFVGIAFQSILQRPPVISSQDCSLKAVSNAASPAPAPSPAATADSADSLGAWSHLNVLTMFISLGVLVVLMAMKRATSTLTLYFVSATVISVALGVGSSFIIGTTENTTVILVYLGGIGIVIIIGAYYSIFTN